MGRAEGIVFAFRALGEAGQAVPLAQGADPVPAPGEDLVRIGLVADVPDQDVLGRLEHGMQGHRQFHDAQARAQMTAGDRNGVDGLRPQLVSDLPEFR